MSDVYMYAAALYCDDCGEAIRARLTAEGKAPADADDESSYDSDEFPKGPYSDGGGEADTAQHCDGCQAFLENALTGDGYADVKGRIEHALCAGEFDSIAVTEWLQFYDIKLSPRAVRFGRMAKAMHEHEHADRDTGELDRYAAGGYPVYYVVGDSEVVCATCANDHETGLSAFGVEFRDMITACDVNWEDPEMYCGCGERIESAYAEPDDTGVHTEGDDK
jgi:hypothetical protein